MANYTQILNFSASASGTTTVALSLKFTPGAATYAPGTAAAVTPYTPAALVAGSNPIGGPVFQDATGGTVITTPITQDNISASETLLNYTLSVNAGSLDSIAAVGTGTVTTYSVGASLFIVGAAPGTVPPGSSYYNDAPSALNAAMDALLASTVDTVGGRSAIQFLAIDNRSVTYSATTNAVTLNTGSTYINNRVASYEDSHTHDTTQLLTSTPTGVTGALRLAGFLNSDPIITSSGSVNIIAWKGVIDLGADLSSQTTNPGFIPSGFIALGVDSKTHELLPVENSYALGGVLISAPSSVAATTAAPQYTNFPFDPATINAFAAAGGDVNIYINTAPQTTAGANTKLAANYMSINLAQADALINSGARVVAVTLGNVAAPSPGSLSANAQTATLSTLAFGDVFKIKDSAANIASMTIESATSLTNIQDIFEAARPQGHFAPSAIEIIPTTSTGAIDTALINLDFAVAQTLANSGFAIAQLAKVNVNIGQGFGTVTDSDILNMVKAGVDKIVFDNTTIPADPGKAAVGVAGTAGYVAAVPAAPERDPFAGQNVRQVIIDQNMLIDVAKVSISGLTVISGGRLVQNKTIDVVVNVDDNAGGVNIPSTLLNKLGVDRIVASDGNLDLDLVEARGLSKTGVFLGTTGDSSDVTLHINNDRDLSSLKSQTVQKLAAVGVDVMSVEIDSSLLDSTPADDPELNLYRSLASSKNLLDSLSAIKNSGMSFDIHGTEIGVSLSSVITPGAGASLVNAISLLGHINVGNVTENHSTHAVTENIVSVSTSGIKDNWIEITDMSRADSGISGVAADVKSIAKAVSANGGAVLLKAGGYNLDSYSAADGMYAGLYDVLYKADGNQDHFVAGMQSFGNLIKGVKNIYVDFRVDLNEPALINSSAVDLDGRPKDFQDSFLTNFSKLGARGIVVDDSVINNYTALEVEIDKTADRPDLANDPLNLPISEMAQTLDIIYALDADNTQSSVGLSKLVYQSGSILRTNGYGFAKDYIDREFRGNANSIDKIVITNAANGDMSIDLSELGLYGADGDGYQGNFNSKVTHLSTDANDTFHLAANNGHDVVIQIVGLTDYRLFTSSDIKES